MSGSGLHRDIRRTIGPDKLWPDAVPVVGTEIPATDNESAVGLDRWAVLNGDGANVLAPLVDRCRGDAAASRHFSLAADGLAGGEDWGCAHADNVALLQLFVKPCSINR